MNTATLSGSLIFAAIFNIFIWGQVLFRAPADTETVYFFDIGQGDSSFVELPGGVQAIIDAGPGKTVVERVESVLPISDRYIDIAILTHPQADHMNGFIDLLKRYRIGVFIINGDAATTQSYAALSDIISKTKTKVLVLGRGDTIAYGNDTFSLLWPPPAGAAADPNDRGTVVKFTSPELSALFTADISADIEHRLLNDTLDSDVLKVPHHGSKYSSTGGFLEKVSPEIAVIQVGKNSYGHPTREALGRLAATETRIFRNDLDGTVKVYREKDGALVAKTQR
jgi:competence protein ComEC